MLCFRARPYFRLLAAGQGRSCSCVQLMCIVSRLNSSGWCRLGSQCCRLSGCRRHLLSCLVLLDLRNDRRGRLR